MKWLCFIVGGMLAPQFFYAQKTMADIHYPENTRFVSLPSGMKIACTDTQTGEGPTLVFVHGLGSNLKGWQKNTEALGKVSRCIALDLPGYGKSDSGPFAFDMAFFAESLRAFIQALDLKNVVLVGHSMGAQVVLTAVLQDPELADKIVLLAPAGFETFTEQEKAWFKMVYTPALLKNTPPEQIRKNFELNFHQFPEDAEFMIQDRMTMRETEVYDSYCNMIPACVMGMLQQPVYDRLPEIKTPTLVLFGADDRLIPNRLLHKDLSTEQVAGSGQRRLPNSRLELIPDCGHFVQWEGAEAVNTAITNFLQQ